MIPDDLLPADLVLGAPYVRASFLTLMLIADTMVRSWGTDSSTLTLVKEELETHWNTYYQFNLFKPRGTKIDVSKLCDHFSQSVVLELCPPQITITPNKMQSSSISRLRADYDSGPCLLSLHQPEQWQWIDAKGEAHRRSSRSIKVATEIAVEVIRRDIQKRVVSGRKDSDRERFLLWATERTVALACQHLPLVDAWAIPLLETGRIAQAQTDQTLAPGCSLLAMRLIEAGVHLDVIQHQRNALFNHIPALVVTDICMASTYHLAVDLERFYRIYGGNRMAFVKAGLPEPEPCLTPFSGSLAGANVLYILNAPMALRAAGSAADPQWHAARAENIVTILNAQGAQVSVRSDPRSRYGNPLHHFPSASQGPIKEIAKSYSHVFVDRPGIAVLDAMKSCSEVIVDLYEFRDSVLPHIQSKLDDFEVLNSELHKVFYDSDGAK